MKSINLPEKWLEKSRTDLLSAKKLANGETKYLETAVYHCQQSGEKALKAFLVSKSINFPKTHDLTFLIKLSIDSDDSFKQLYEECEILTPYSVEYRYPDDIAEPSVEDYELACKSSFKIFDFVSDKLLLKLL